MSMITEKRNEVFNKLNSLLAERKATIDNKVNAYRISLESEPVSEEIVNARKLLNALDEVIACEADFVKATQPTVAETITAATPETNITIAEADIKATEEVNEVPEDASFVEAVEITVNPETKEAEITSSIENARPGMAYVSIPERR